jgi:type III restriction enzyme
MSNPFFERPILNSPYEYPSRHWELDADGQPTQTILNVRRRANFITPIPKPKKRRGQKGQGILEIDEGMGLSDENQQYDTNWMINEVRGYVNRWRGLSGRPSGVTEQTAQLLQHWRNYDFQSVRPFFCQLEAVETAVWLWEVAPKEKNAKYILDYLSLVNTAANPELSRLALKLATGAGKTTVMAMLIAWQTVNAIRQPGSDRLPP